MSDHVSSTGGYGVDMRNNSRYCIADLVCSLGFKAASITAGQHSEDLTPLPRNDGYYDQTGRGETVSLKRTSYYLKNNMVLVLVLICYQMSDEKGKQNVMI